MEPIILPIEDVLDLHTFRPQDVPDLLDDYLNPGGRLIIGPWAVRRDSTDLEDRLSSWGYEPTGWLLKSQGDDVGLARKMIWFDNA